MPSVEKTTRDALATVVTTALSASSGIVVATFDEIPDLSLISTSVPTAYVYVDTRRTTAGSRTSREVDLVLHINLLKPIDVGPDRETEVDDMLELASDLESSIESSSLAFVGFENGDTGRQAYDIDKLREHNVFSTVLSPVIRTYVTDA